MRIAAAAVAAVLVVVASSPVRAGDDIRAAREHFEKGKRLYDLGRFGEAAKEYEAAYQAKDDPALLFNLGQAYRLAGNHQRSLLAYKAYLRNVPAAPNRAEVEEHIREMQLAVDEENRQKATSQPPPTTTSTQPAPLPGPEAPRPNNLQAVGTTAVSPAATPAERPVYKRPWFWAVLAGGAVVVATGITLGVVFGGSTKNPTPSMGVATAAGF